MVGGFFRGGTQIGVGWGRRRVPLTASGPATEPVRWLVVRLVGRLLSREYTVGCRHLSFTVSLLLLWGNIYFFLFALFASRSSCGAGVFSPPLRFFFSTFPLSRRLLSSGFSPLFAVASRPHRSSAPCCCSAARFSEGIFSFLVRDLASPPAGAPENQRSDLWPLFARRFFGGYSGTRLFCQWCSSTPLAILSSPCFMCVLRRA